MNTPHPTPRFGNAAIRLMVMELMRLAIETPREIADVHVRFSGHCNSIDVDVFAGGWDNATKDAAGHRARDFQRDLYLDHDNAEDKLADLLTSVRECLSRCPQIVAERAAHEAAEAQRERQEFGAAVVRYREAKEAGASEEALRALAIECDRLMGAMKYAARDGIWWDGKHGTWGLGTLTEDDHEAMDHGAVMSGPHS